MSTRSLGLLIASLLLAFAVAASAAPAKKTTRHHEKRPDKASGPALIVRGDQVSTEGLVYAVAKAFDATGDGHLDVQPFNTIDGIDQALSGQVDMAASARPAYAGRAQEAGLTFTPVAWDALVLITNVANPVNNLTLRQVHDIYYGQVKNWSQVGGPDEPIDLDGVASPLDGVQYSFRELMFGNGDNPVAVPRLFINIDSLQSEVSLDTKALALSTLVHARRQKDIRIIPIEGVMPTLATLENGSYPLPLRIYLAYKPDSPKIATIQKFLAFIGSPQMDGILRGHDLLPYAQATVLNAQSELDRINVIGARMVAEGLPPAYAPGNEFARLAALHGQGQGPADVARTAAIQRAAANQATAADQQRVALSEAAGVDPSPAAGAATPAPGAAPAAAAASKQSVDYTVVSGDTLSKIARKHSVSVEDLRRWNDLHSDMLKVGQVLKMSPSRSSASTGRVTCSTTC